MLGLKCVFDYQPFLRYWRCTDLKLAWKMPASNLEKVPHNAFIHGSHTPSSLVIGGLPPFHQRQKIQPAKGLQSRLLTLGALATSTSWRAHTHMFPRPLQGGRKLLTVQVLITKFHFREGGNDSPLKSNVPYAWFAFSWIQIGYSETVLVCHDLWIDTLGGLDTCFVGFRCPLPF